MKRPGLWVAIAIVLASNLAALGRAAANRAGEPEAILELTERELALPPRQAENTSLTLRLVWLDPEPREGGPGWFDREKLEAVGFDCRTPVTRENAASYRSLPPRSAFAVLEYEGDRWRKYLDEGSARRVDATDRPAEPIDGADDRDARQRRSHLVVTDVGLDAEALRARYPDRRRAAILPAVVTARLREVPGGAPFLQGRVALVQPPELNVPRRDRPMLESLRQDARAAGRVPTAGSSEPRYRVTVTWGRVLEPWITGVRR